ncbi:hypothetical protein AG1IA_03010 [Rhizoctonia solani AG-1 IA]|uniref:Uncharacterized protein n=1 Tax=Thanatephorus cucumeris (strain AG1-IA) TaxID=983506 RepID=L8WY76_THACA|nr:hypothetical protein AG1IA_03010 [Rhizoctonia solani AG-1 IA]
MLQLSHYFASPQTSSENVHINGRQAFGGRKTNSNKGCRKWNGKSRLQIERDRTRHASGRMLILHGARAHKKWQNRLTGYVLQRIPCILVKDKVIDSLSNIALTDIDTLLPQLQ